MTIYINLSSPSRNATEGYLGLCLLYAHLLEVDELGLVNVEEEAASVLALGVGADGGLRVLELLLYIAYDAVAVTALEHTRDQLWVHRVSSKNQRRS